MRRSKRLTLDLNRLRLPWSRKHPPGMLFHKATVHGQKQSGCNSIFTKGMRRERSVTDLGMLGLQEIRNVTHCTFFIERAIE